MVIPTVPSESPFSQDLSRCDYFRTSLKIVEADICMVVGVSAGFGKTLFSWIPHTYFEFHEIPALLPKYCLSQHVYQRAEDEGYFIVILIT